jgi:RimJ/RimL family protein N-acetyltransferase
VTIRRLGVGDCELVHALRLRALQDAPAAFGSTYEHEAAFTPDVWRSRLATDGNAHFLWESGEHGASGLVAVVRDDRAGDLHSWLVGMWVDPAARGTGAADALVDAVLQFARHQRIPLVRLHVAEGNERAERLYARHGFERTGDSFVRQRDGMREIEMERRTA